MDFPSLLAAAQNSPDSDIYVNSFKGRFSDYEFVFVDYPTKKTSKISSVWNKLTNSGTTERPDLKIYDKTIRIYNFEQCLQTLRTFGSVIRNITLLIEKLGTKESIEIIQHVKQYCANSLVKLGVDVGTADPSTHNLLSFKLPKLVDLDILMYTVQTNPDHVFGLIKENPQVGLNFSYNNISNVGNETFNIAEMNFFYRFAAL